MQGAAKRHTTQTDVPRRRGGPHRVPLSARGWRPIVRLASNHLSRTDPRRGTPERIFDLTHPKTVKRHSSDHRLRLRLRCDTPSGRGSPKPRRTLSEPTEEGRA